MQIRTRLTLQFLVIVAFIVLAAFFAIYYFSAQYRESSFYARLQEKASTTADLLLKTKEVDSTLLKIIDRTKKDLLYKESISVYDNSGKRIYSSQNQTDFSSAEKLNEIRSTGEVRWTDGEYEILGFQYSDNGKQFLVIAGAIDKFGLNKLDNLGNVLGISFVFILMVVAVAGWFYAGRSLRPISRIVTQVNSMSAANLSERLDEGNRRDEVARLSATFNEMLDRIEDTFQLQKTFVANASHELKNPLTKITSQLEVVLLRERMPEDYRKTISSVLEDIRALNEVSLRLLDLARLGSDEMASSFLPTRVDELLWQCNEEVSARHSDYRLHFSLNLPEDERLVVVLGNDYLLKTAFTNLIENGCKFSRKKEVHVSLETGNNEVTIKFRDEGMGIAEQDLPNIFQPFYRGQNVVSIPGHGIGLSLVEKIVKLHRATIFVISQPGAGSTFTISIPSAPATHV